MQNSAAMVTYQDRLVVAGKPVWIVPDYEDGPAYGSARAWLRWSLLNTAVRAMDVARGVSAYHALLRADQATPLDVDDLDRLATAAYLSGRDAEFQRVLERLYRVHVESGDPARAARCACWLALLLVARRERPVECVDGPRPAARREPRRRRSEAMWPSPSPSSNCARDDADAAHATAGQAVAIGEGFGDRTSRPRRATRKAAR